MRTSRGVTVRHECGERIVCNSCGSVVRVTAARMGEDALTEEQWVAVKLECDCHQEWTPGPFGRAAVKVDA